jgi:hypothetical protein
MAGANVVVSAARRGIGQAVSRVTGGSQIARRG